MHHAGERKHFNINVTRNPARDNAGKEWFLTYRKDQCQSSIAKYTLFIDPKEFEFIAASLRQSPPGPRLFH